MRTFVKNDKKNLIDRTRPPSSRCESNLVIIIIGIGINIGIDIGIGIRTGTGTAPYPILS